MKRILLALSIAACLSACSGNKNEQKEVETQEEKAEWVSLFNGKDLDGWTIKITQYPVGENFGNTFSIEDGLLKVRYDDYGDHFDGRFGHIYTNKTYSNYKLRVEYRFVGEQAKGAPEWAYRNSGVLFHAQAPEAVLLDQDFPVSIEAQFLGGNGTDERTTGNVCTPGTEIHINDQLYTDHCYSSNSKTYHGDQWVTFEMVVYGDSLVHHIMEGDTILTYTKLAIGGGSVNPNPSLPAGPLKEGRITLQSEGHPVDFRKVEIMELSK